MIETRLTEFRARKDALNEELVKLSVEAHAFMTSHCPVKVGDVVDWVRADRSTVPLRVSYIEQFGYRWLPSVLEKPAVRGYVVQSDGSEEPQERSIYCNWHVRGAAPRPARTRVRPAAPVARTRTRTRG